MEDAARRFARRVLLIHLLLLAVVVVLVYEASHQIYRHARQQARESAETRESLIASQTARGIESYYQSIIENLDLLRLSDNGGSPQTRPVGPINAKLGEIRQTHAVLPCGPLEGGGALLGTLFWCQLE